MAKELFREVQHFRGNILWTVLLFLPVLIFSTVLIIQLVTGEGLGDHPMSNWALGLIVVFVLIPAIWAERTVKLTTIVDEENLIYGWNMPTDELNVLPLSDIVSWEIIRYRFVGYGYRISKMYGTVHNLSGDWGLQLKTIRGEKILIGTHRRAELERVMRSVKATSA